MAAAVGITSWFGCGCIALFSIGCERGPLEVDCPNAGVGDLVVSEVRGDQAGSTDTQGEWIELFNASGSTIDLLGLRASLRTLQGGSASEFTVRSSVTVDAGEYVTLGRFPEGGEPTHISYGYAGDLDSSLFDTAALELFVCGVEIDQVVYRGLPSTGTLALDGDLAPPDAETNDTESNFCIDVGDSGVGTPQQENRPCP